MGRGTDWKRKKLSLQQETGQVYSHLKNTSTTREATYNIRPTMDQYPRNG